MEEVCLVGFVIKVFPLKEIKPIPVEQYLSIQSRWIEGVGKVNNFNPISL